MEYRECACGCVRKFIPNKPWQKYINHAHQVKAERQRRCGKTAKTKEKQWNKMSSLHRWEKMTLSEVETEGLRLHLTYGQLQVMAQNNTLPKDFGKGVRKK